MTPLSHVRGKAYAFGRDDCDTDTIFPARHMKTIARSGLGRFAFEVLRQDPGSCFNDARVHRAPFLVAGRNFGCGSSREHAVWCLADIGVRAIFAISFADIFWQNAGQNGIAAIALGEADIQRLMESAARYATIDLDLEAQVITVDGYPDFPFQIEPSLRARLMAGTDQIDETLQALESISLKEDVLRKTAPWSQLEGCS
jgi:3-isopropylmalate/(R)-2-methylmalate dehydratase small subunit